MCVELKKEKELIKKKELEWVRVVDKKAERERREALKNYDPCIHISIRYLDYWAIVRQIPVPHNNTVHSAPQWSITAPF